MLSHVMLLEVVYRKRPQLPQCKSDNCQRCHAAGRGVTYQMAELAGSQASGKQRR